MFKSLLKLLWVAVKYVYKLVSYLVVAGFVLFGVAIVTFVLYLVSQRGSLLASTDRPLPGKDGFLYLNLEQVSETSFEEPVYANLARNLGYPVANKVSVTDLKEIIEAASKDKRIKGIFVDVDKASFETFAVGYELNRALVKYKTETKNPVYGYSRFYGLADLVTLKDADKLLIDKVGNFSADGFSVSSFFLKDFYKKYGIKDYSYQSGKYGLDTLLSQNGWTDDNKFSVDSLAHQPLVLALEEINAGRKTKITPELLGYENFVDFSNKLVSPPAYFTEQGLFSQVVTTFEFGDFLRKEAGVDKNKYPKIFTINQYKSDMRSRAQAPDETKDYYLTYYYAGSLSKGSINPNDIAAELYSYTVNKAEPKKGQESNQGKLRGVVLRINSLGGDIPSAQTLYDTLKTVSGAGVPVVVSVGDVLAGATFVGSQGADAIVAERTAAVGAVNVSSQLLDVTDTLRAFYNINPSYFVGSKLTAQYGGLPFPFSLVAKSNTLTAVDPLYATYRQIRADGDYRTLVTLLAEKRGLEYAKADELSQGKVYTGVAAKEAGLIDSLGGVEQAYAELDRLNKAKDEKFDPASIIKYEANPDSGRYSSLLATLNNELAKYEDYKLRVANNLSVNELAAFKYVFANQGNSISYCFACVNHASANSVHPLSDPKGAASSFKLFDNR